MKNDLLTLEELNSKKLQNLLEKAQEIKSNPKDYSEMLLGKTLLSIFEKPSLRTRISFEVGIHQLGGKAITVDAGVLPMGKKESIEDTAKVSSRYVDIIMARMFKHDDIEKLAENATVPVINGLTDLHHPCQILSDLLTIKEKKEELKGLKLAFLGDGNNNVTHSLILGCCLAEMDISVGCPKNHMPNSEIVKKAKVIANGNKIEITDNAKKAIENGEDVKIGVIMNLAQSLFDS